MLCFCNLWIMDSIIPCHKNASWSKHFLHFFLKSRSILSKKNAVLDLCIVLQFKKTKWLSKQINLTHLQLTFTMSRCSNYIGTVGTSFRQSKGSKKYGILYLSSWLITYYHLLSRDGCTRIKADWYLLYSIMNMSIVKS